MKLRVLLDGELLNGQPFTLVDHPDDLGILTIQEKSLIGRLSLDATDLANFNIDKAKKAVREDIDKEVADTTSLLGDTADITAILLVRMAKLAKALSVAQSLAEVRAAAQPMTDLSASLLADIEAGTCVLPYQNKEGGEASALKAATDHATAVANILNK